MPQKCMLPSPQFPMGQVVQGDPQVPIDGDQVATGSRLFRAGTQAWLLGSATFCCVTLGQCLGFSGPCFGICQRNVMTLLTS